MNIRILGIGGVSGYFGGKLAAHYHHSDAVHIIFIARPATAELIRENGLKLLTPEGERTVHPFKAASRAEEAGPLDVLILLH